MSWEETLHQLVRKYYRAGPGDPPTWVSASAVPEPVARTNVTCGDRVVVYLEGRVKAEDESTDESTDESAVEPRRIWLDVAGCAICKASAEMVVRAGEVLSPRDLATLAREMLSSMEGSSDSEGVDTGPSPVSVAMPPGAVPPEDIETILTLRDVPGRRRCASLPWEAVLDALNALDASR